MDANKTQELAAIRKRLSEQAEIVRAESKALQKTLHTLLAASIDAGFEPSNSPYFRFLFQGLPNPAVIFKQAGNDFVMVDYNPAAQAFTRGQMPEYMGRTARELFLPYPELLDKFTLCSETKTPQEHSTQYRMLSTGEDKFFEMTLAFMPPEFILLIANDLTERKRADEKILRLGSELEQRDEYTIHQAGIIDLLEQKNRELTLAQEQVSRLNEALKQRAEALEAANKELDAFAYSVSHDLRAPLSTIEEFSRILLDEFGTFRPEEAQNLLKNLNDNAVAMGQMVQALLAFSRAGRTPLKKERVNLTLLATQALQTLHQEPARQGLTLDIHDLGEAEADPVLLKQVWVNLIGNALKFTRTREQARIEIGCTAMEGSAAYFVRDNGVGFDEDQAHKLFGVFQRLHGEDEFEGNGVGLAIVERIIRRHGGRVWAEGHLDAGATFYFTLA